MNGILKLDLGSFADALVFSIASAVGVAAFGVLYSATQGGGFDVFTADWGAIFHLMVNTAFVTGVASIAKDLMSTSAGSVLGLTPPYSTEPKPATVVGTTS